MSVYLPYYPTWEDEPDTDTPITAAALNNMEAGIIAASQGGVDYKGEWAAGTAYMKGDVVSHDGIEYVAVNPSTGQEPLAPGLPEDPLPPAAPTGVVMAFAGAAAPLGFLICDGAAVSRATNAALFAVIGTTYGAGDGVTTFNLPDMRGRAPFGKGTHGYVDALGENEGVDVSVRIPQHRHTVSDPGHSHMIGGGSNDGGGNPQFGTNSSGIWYGTTSMTTGIVVGLASTALDAPPYLILNYIIKT